MSNGIMQNNYYVSSIFEYLIQLTWFVYQPNLYDNTVYENLLINLRKQIHRNKVMQGASDLTTYKLHMPYHKTYVQKNKCRI